MKRLWFALVVLSVLAAVLSVPSSATQKTATEAASYYETPTIVQYRYTTPSLAALGVDTCLVVISLPEKIPYLLNSSVPTWRVLVGARTSTANVDSIKCEMWLGRTGRDFKNNGLTGVHTGAQKAFDVTLYPLPIYRTMTLYVTNGDSTAAAWTIDVGILKGWLP